MADRDNMNKTADVDQNVTNSAKLDDGSLHVVHKNGEATDDFLLKVVKTGGYRTMTND
ncbi:hypothetical protein [Bacillus sp. V3-13]|uniref:hypothetical protein n=1 Tax=Bacillus sp. V3-13 TaxID=2053728 RepID=UPI0015E154DF|nr:hypothetical protein [Bacillus sp. V3-13]